MVVKCQSCGNEYDDAERWKYCPHPRYDNLKAGEEIEDFNFPGTIEVPENPDVTFEHCNVVTVRDTGKEVCGCPTLENGDVRCHICGEYVNDVCWKCRAPRGEGKCPNPKGETTEAKKLIDNYYIEKRDNPKPALIDETKERIQVENRTIDGYLGEIRDLRETMLRMILTCGGEIKIPESIIVGDIPNNLSVKVDEDGTRIFKVW